MTKKTLQGLAAAKSWTRAKKLAKLAKLTPKAARHYLAHESPTPEQLQALDKYKIGGLIPKPLQTLIALTLYYNPAPENITAKALAASKSWTRAKILAGLAGISVYEARHYIAAHVIDPQVLHILDHSQKPNSEPDLQQLANRAANLDFNKKPRKSKGNPTKPPRAGAGAGIKPNKDIQTNILQQLAELARQHGGLAALHEGLNQLESLQLPTKSPLAQHLSYSTTKALPLSDFLTGNANGS